VPRSLVETLTEHFYAWERRGRGWDLWPYSVELEPPFRPLISGPDLPDSAPQDDGQRPTLLSRLTDRLTGAFKKTRAPMDPSDSEEPWPAPWAGHPQLSELVVTVPAEMHVSREAAEQFLLAIPPTAGPLSYDIVATADAIRLVFSCAKQNEDAITSPLKAYFPDVVIAREPDALAAAWHSAPGSAARFADFGLAHEFMVPLRILKRFDVDPLAGVIAAVARLGKGEVMVVQVLMTRTRHPWPREVMRAVLDDRGAPFFIDAPEIAALAKAKISRPLFACGLRTGIKTGDHDRSLQLARQLTGALGAMGDPTGNELMPLEDGAEAGVRDQEADLLARRTRRSGMLVSVEELVSLLHLPTPGVQEPKLLRHARRTRRAPVVTAGAGVLLGTNIHDGLEVDVRLAAAHRSRHAYVIGASGTGKSTLLLNLIRQDMEAGAGLAVLDPHGDLVDRALDFVPERRMDDIILLDPADGDFPIGFNILSASTDLEKTLLSSDLVTVFQRQSLSWGDQMNSVLGNAVLAFLESSRGGTLVDLRRFLVEDRFRKEYLTSVHDPDVVYFWQREFPLLRGRPQAPILTRLDTFLRPKPIRYMVAQQESRLELRRVMDEGKILLCRLSHGAIGEENAHLLGSLVVSKIHQMAMSRQDVAEAERRPFYLYIDEFHHFVTPSMAQILSGARKYGLGLVLAHQDLRQLQSRSSDVLASVLSNPATRVCFRVGDEDARLLAKGLSNFSADDLQNLSIGEAIARVERADWDFNLQTAALPAVDGKTAESKRARIVENSRTRYAKPRAEVEAKLREAREEVDQPTVEIPTPTSPPRRVEAATQPVEPPTAGAPDVEVPTPPSNSGRGGKEHKYLQGLIARWAGGRGWGVVVEESVLGDLGRVDVALRKDGLAIACEIVVCSEKRRLGHIRTLAKARLGAEQFGRVHLVTPDEVFDLLDGLHLLAPQKETTVRGYRVRVRMAPGKAAEGESKRSAVSAVIAKALRRMKSAKR
jgi:hypothetical protein